MGIENSLDSILNTATKVKILRLFSSRTDEFRSSGREIAKSVKVSPPAAHTALKELYSQGILKLEIIGKQHIYSLNSQSRLVKDILKPSFKKELSLKQDMSRFLIEKIKNAGIKSKIMSIILYGSLQTGKSTAASDADIAVVVRDKADLKKVGNVFTESIAAQFSEYFGINLDAYIKSKEEFISRVKNNKPPVSSLLKSYSIIFGVSPIELRRKK
jgi:predicted nucleotidyltransferase